MPSWAVLEVRQISQVLYARESEQVIIVLITCCKPHCKSQILHSVCTGDRQFAAEENEVGTGNVDDACVLSRY